MYKLPKVKFFKPRMTQDDPKKTQKEEPQDYLRMTQADPRLTTGNARMTQDDPRIKI